MTGRRIALLAPCCTPDRWGPRERFADALAAALAAGGDSVTLIAAHGGRPTRTRTDGFSTVRLWRPPEGRLRRRLYDDHLAHVPFSRVALRRGRYELAHALHQTDAAAALEWSAGSGRPVVYSQLSVPAPEMLAARRRRLEGVVRALSASSAVVSPSEAVAQALERVLGFASRVIAPGVDLEFFTPGGERSEQPTIFCPGGIGASDGGARAALALVAEARPEVRLTGGGAVGGLDSLRAAYREAWVVLNADPRDGLGLTELEANACGTPAVGGSSEPRPLADALLAALDGPGRDPRAHAEQFPIDRCAAAHADLYAELLSPSG